nr:hypothetical protein [uncultured Celeribacter sp.]
MYRNHKSATCCYCGTKSVLSFGASTRHELKCATCGAPLSRMKSLRDPQDGAPHRPRPETRSPVTRHAVAEPQPRASKKKKKQKKRKSVAYQLLDAAEDLWDLFD